MSSGWSSLQVFDFIQQQRFDRFRDITRDLEEMSNQWLFTSRDLQNINLYSDKRDATSLYIIESLLKWIYSS